MEPKYPAVTEVDLSSGPGGNSFAVLGECRKAMTQAGVSREEIGIFFKEATSGDYEHLLRTILKWMTVINKDEVLAKIGKVDTNPQESEDDEEVPEMPDDVPDIEDWEVDEVTKGQEEEEVEEVEISWDDDDDSDEEEDLVSEEDSDEGVPF